VKQVPVCLLSLMQPNWRQFIDSVKEVLGYSPTRGLDACAAITHRDPASWLACLDLRNEPLDAIRNGRQRGLFQHYFISFMFCCEEDTLVKLNEMTTVATVTAKVRHDYVVIASGTVQKWHDAVVSGCKIEVEWELRSITCGIYNLLLNMGFREAFQYKKIDQRDGTFTLH